METINHKKRAVIALCRKLPVWGLVYQQNHGYLGDSFESEGKMTFQEARLTMKKLCHKMHISKLNIVLDIQGYL